MEIWNHYDADGEAFLRLPPPQKAKTCYFISIVDLRCSFPGNGYIEGSELDSFLREFVSSVNASDVNPMVGITILNDVFSSSFMWAIKRVGET